MTITLIEELIMICY